MPDEAYYWVWSHHLQLSYFDHPPMVAWLFKLGHSFENYGHLVRIPGLLLGHANLITWYFIFKNLNLDFEKFKIWAVLSFTFPLLGFGSIILTPDLPVIFFWSLCLLYFIKILKESSLKNYILLGTFLGLGFISKYHIVLFPLIGIIYLSSQKKWHSIKKSGILLTLLFGLIFSSPVIIWNFQNNFQSFAFQLSHGLQHTKWEWQWPFEYLLGHVLLISPVFCYFLYTSRFWKIKENQENQLSLTIFSSFSLGIFIFFQLTSFRSSVELNWTIMAFPSLLALVTLIKIPKGWLRAVNFFWSTFNVVLIVTMFNGVYLHGKIFEPFFFEKNKNLPNEFKPLYGINYQTAASLWYHSKVPVLKLVKASRYDFFDTLKVDYVNFPKTFYVIKEKNNEYPQWVYDIKPQAEIVKKLDKDYLIEKVTLP